MTKLPDPLHIFKLSGAGNDFVAIDARAEIDLDHEAAGALAARLCRRRVDVGADGLMLLGPPPASGEAFRMTYYNANGTHGAACGNGARALAHLARHLGVFETEADFLTDAGRYTARFDGDRLHIQMSDGLLIEPCRTVDDPDVPCVDFLDIGLPHAVAWLESAEVLAEYDVDRIGRRLRHHESFGTAGTNVNFAASEPGESDGAVGRIAIRTFERGVEAETLACGTGCVATAASYLASSGAAEGVVELRTAGGDLLRASLRLDGNRVVDVTLTGPARIVFEGDVRLGED